MFLPLGLMSLALGVSSFVAGVLPLSFAFSRNHLVRLSSLGTGLLLGTALGVILPEGLESVVSHSLQGSKSANVQVFPTSQIAYSLLVGFACMLVIEHLAPHSCSQHTDDLPLHNVKVDAPENIFDAEALESGGSMDRGRADHIERSSSSHLSSQAVTFDREIPFTAGLFIHGLTDGLALGAAAFTPDAAHNSSHLTLIVFVALMLHKAPTSLAFTLSLLSNNVTRAKCKKHLAIFSSSTPLGTMLSYVLMSFLAPRDNKWSGFALLFSGGSFLYVATVLQPVSAPTAKSELRPKIRVIYVIIGMFAPPVINTILAHKH